MAAVSSLVFVGGSRGTTQKSKWQGLFSPLRQQHLVTTIALHLQTKSIYGFIYMKISGNIAEGMPSL